MHTYRHTAVTNIGIFRTDFVGQQYPFAVVYCGWGNLPKATNRRLAEKEGICYGWARSFGDAERLKQHAINDDCSFVGIVRVDIRELP